MATQFKVTYTYEILSDESAKNGCSQENGFARYNGISLEIDFAAPECFDADFIPDWHLFSTREDAMLHILRACHCCDENELNSTENDFYQCDPDIDFNTGYETYFACHIEKI